METSGSHFHKELIAGLPSRKVGREIGEGGSSLLFVCLLSELGCGWNSMSM